jgi:ribosome maturation factor RimP
MSPEQVDLAIYHVAHRLAQEQGLEIIEVKIGRHLNDTLIQILADKPGGGIGIGACTALNRSIVEAIDKEAILSEDGYSLEVSSPGLDRPMTTSKDFLRNIDKEVHLYLKERIEGKMEHVGVVISVTDDNLTFFAKKLKKEIIVPLNQIEKGLLVI